MSNSKAEYMRNLVSKSRNVKEVKVIFNFLEEIVED